MQLAGAPLGYLGGKDGVYLVSVGLPGIDFEIVLPGTWSVAVLEIVEVGQLLLCLCLFCGSPLSLQQCR